ncbi:histidine kinase [Pararobbsia alpina]|uniref:ATP-binding protein n=1 Tax=Pararobbsia alpina TaxID=621374 RepID=UPI0039A71A7A
MSTSVNSIRRMLLVWLLGGLAIVMAIASVLVYRQALDEATELFDFALRELAVTVPPSLDAARLASQDKLFIELSEEEVGTQVWVDNKVDPDYRWPENSTLPRLPPGLHTIRHDGIEWRVFGLSEPERYVEVAQPIEVRDLLARRIALRTLVPLGIGAAIFAVFVWWTIGHSLRSLRVLSSKLSRRSVSEVAPITMEAPAEIRPVVSALNGLLKRLDDSLQAQRTFIADAAHELRSPLAALKLQVQLAQTDITEPSHQHHMARIDARLTRTIHLAEQLLTLAREDANGATEPKANDLLAVVSDVVTDLSVVAEKKKIDLGIIEGHTPCWVVADAHGLRTLLWNLIDNAVRYTQDGGCVDVRIIDVSEEEAAVEIIDNGIGIPTDELHRVFDRFYRGSDSHALGSGLGLSIVKRVAERLKLTITLENVKSGQGVHVIISGLKRGVPATPEVSATQFPSRIESL